MSRPARGEQGTRRRIPVARSGVDPAGCSRALDETETQAWQTVAAVLVRLPAALDADLQRAAGMSFLEYRILAALAQGPRGSLRLGALARTVSVSPSTLSRAMTRLEARGWVDRAVDPVARRYTLGRLTDVGREQVRAAEPTHTAAVRRLVFDRLADEQVHQLRALGRDVQTALDAEDVPGAE